MLLRFCPDHALFDDGEEVVPLVLAQLPQQSLRLEELALALLRLSLNRLCDSCDDILENALDEHSQEVVEVELGLVFSDH